ncbi:MAG TPA: ribosomal protein S18-alanine N-acetyltransferase [Paenalcaligenes sp.]|nr:ribosomal protein S18-alanine N-acetyltransferase [Paenalcaligenes sp.]
MGRTMRGDTLDVSVRDMKAVDIAAVAAIEAQVQPQQPWSVGNFRDAYMSFYTMIVAEVEHRIAGYAVVMVAPDVGELLLIGVSPEYQGQGVGRALMAEVEQRLANKGLATIVLEVRRSNLQAQRFYTQQGFAQVGLRKNYYDAGEGQREDALLLSRTFKQVDP